MKRNSKEAIVTAAISLFNTKGYNGTSIRDIAGKAKVNVANISYYFQNKNGLLEYCFITYFEKYLAEIEKGLNELEVGSVPCLKKITENLLYFQCENIHLTRFILRETSIDSQVVREIMSTYLVKERYYFTKILDLGMDRKEIRKITSTYFILQLKGLLNMPFLNSHYVTEVLYILPNENYFATKYLGEIFSWIDSTLKLNQSDKNQMLISY
jgi:AcrR family transcriptional regulator